MFSEGASLNFAWNIDCTYFGFYDRMTVHRKRFPVNKTNRCTEFQLYWYYYCTCFGQSFCPSSGVLSYTSALVHFMQLWWLFATRSRMELQFHPRMELQFHPNPGSSHNCKKVTKADVRRRSHDTCRVVIPIKLEFSASVGFIHKESTVLYLPKFST
jgi:hypothetical protein